LFEDFPAVNYVVRFRNDGKEDSPILENVKALDLQVEAGGDFTLHHSNGTNPGPADFSPYTEKMQSGISIKMSPTGGKSSHNALPFFNLQWPNGGLAGAIGWTGQWSFEASQQQGRTVNLMAGQETCHLRLHP